MIASHEHAAWPRGTQENSWASFHLFYHEDRIRLLRRLVAPLAEEAFRRGLVDRFFFLQYGLGGPHVRLRFRHGPGRREALEALAQRRSAEFFETCPSMVSVPPERIALESAAILRYAPLESDDGIYPDNHLELFAFRPEVERYGGVSLLPAAFEMFEASSLAALGALLRGRGSRRTKQMVRFFQLLFCQAMGFSDDGSAIGDWMVFSDYFRPRSEAVVEAADRVFDRQGRQLADLMERELADPSFPLILGAASRFVRAVKVASSEVARRALMSQLHMTANRLGITNREEIYICRLMERAWDGVSQGLRDVCLDRDYDVPALKKEALRCLAGPTRAGERNKPLGRGVEASAQPVFMPTRNDLESM